MFEHRILLDECFAQGNQQSLSGLFFLSSRFREAMELPVWQARVLAVSVCCSRRECQCFGAHPATNRGAPRRIFLNCDQAFRVAKISSPAFLSASGYHVSVGLPVLWGTNLASLRHFRSHRGGCRPDVFRASYPSMDQFCHHLDPKLSSNFWRRVSPS